MNDRAAPLRILLADDHEVVREGLRSILNRRTDEFIVVAEAADGEEAVTQWSLHRPDVGLLDLRMPRLDGVGAIRAIRAAESTAKLVILTTYDTDEDIYQGLRAGARGYLLKDADRGEILEAIRTVARGGTHLPPAVAGKLATHVDGDAPTPKEIEVLRAIADGLTNKQIARALSIAEGTVKTHVKSLFSKLGASSRTEAVKMANARGFLRPWHLGPARPGEGAAEALPRCAEP